MVIILYGALTGALLAHPFLFVLLAVLLAIRLLDTTIHRSELKELSNRNAVE